MNWRDILAKAARAAQALLLAWAKTQGPPARPTPTVPTEPPRPVEPPKPTTAEVWVAVSGPSDDPVPGAQVRLQTATSPDTWVEGTTGHDGRIALTVPASLVDSHLRVSAEDYLPLSQHVDVTAGATLRVRLERCPTHKPHPPADRWFPVDGDLCGLVVPEIRPYGRTDRLFTPVTPCYPPEVREAIYRAERAAGHTHTVRDPRPWYRDVYPSGDVSDPRVFAGVLHEALDHDLIPMSVLEPARGPGRNAITLASSPEFVLAEADLNIGPILDDPECRDLMRLCLMGWEINDHMSPEAMEALARWQRRRLHPDALLFAHFTPDHSAGSGPGETEQRWWLRLANDNVLDGIALQLNPAATLEEQVERIKDFTIRLTGGYHQWPTRQTDGSAMRVIVFEFSAYAEVHDGMRYDEAQRRHRIFELIPGVSGVTN